MAQRHEVIEQLELAQHNLRSRNRPAGKPHALLLRFFGFIEQIGEVLKFDGSVDYQGLPATAKKFPEYFRSPKPGELPRMVSDTKLEREFLQRFGGTTNLFRTVEAKREIK